MEAARESPLIDLDLQYGWQFVPEKMPRSWLEGAGSDAHTLVTLPHCWNEEDTFVSGVVFRRGWGSYRTFFELETHREGIERWFLDVGPFFGSARIWLNGRSLGRFEGRYLGFRVEVGDHLRAGPNCLAFLVENRHQRGRLPGRPDPDFLLYGGLAGGVRLLGRGRHCFERHGVDFSVSLDERGVGSVSLAEPDVGPEVSRLVVSAAGEEHSGAEPIEWPGPELWSPEHPCLHSIVFTLEDEDGRVTDQTDRRIGFRQAAFGANGLELNGSRYSLHGMNRHQSLPGFGNALPSSLERFDVEQIKEFGGNCVRTAHYPQTPCFLDGCDELGLFVYAEVCSWKTVAAGAWLREAKRQLEEMVRRDRHRPSVLLWGMGNESRSRKAYLDLGALVKRLDGERPVTYAENHLYRAKREKTTDLVDVWGVNYELHVIDEAKQLARTGAVLATECMNPCLEQIQHELPDSPTEAQLFVLEREMNQLEEEPGVAGYFVWCYADYATLYRNRSRREAGLFEANRRAKPGAWFFRARNTKGGSPFVRVHADWRKDGSGKRAVRVISNCPEVDLRSGEGDSQVAQRVVLRAGLADLELDFTGAALRFSVPGDSEILEQIAPWGPARRLCLSVVRRFSDLVLVAVGALDEGDAMVRDFAGRVRLRTEGGWRLRVAGGEEVVELREGVAWVWLSFETVMEPETGNVLIASCETLEDGRLEVPHLKDPI